MQEGAIPHPLTHPSIQTHTGDLLWAERHLGGGILALCPVVYQEKDLTSLRLCFLGKAGRKMASVLLGFCED